MYSQQVSRENQILKGIRDKEVEEIKDKRKLKNII